MYLSLVRKYHNPLEIKSRIYISFQGRQKHARFNAEEFIYHFRVVRNLPDLMLKNLYIILGSSETCQI